MVNKIDIKFCKNQNLKFVVGSGEQYLPFLCSDWLDAFGRPFFILAIGLKIDGRSPLKCISHGFCLPTNGSVGLKKKIKNIKSI